MWKNLFRDLWQLVIDTQDGFDWDEVDARMKELTNKPQYRPIQQLVIDWCLAYMNYLEEKRKNETKKQRPTGQRGEADTARG